MSGDQYTVDIPMCVYNHEKFIGQAIEGVVMQQTNFKYRLIIGEDCSTDRSREIVKAYQAKYPEKIQVLFHEKNLGPYENSRILFRKCTSKYTALCDGDDYWTDPSKLQSQVDFLEANPSAAGCFHDVIAVDENGNLLRDNYYDSPQEVYNQHDSITKHGGRYATCALLFRSMVLRNYPDWFSKAISDYAVDILITEYGNIVHMPKNMGAYRIHKGGIWQGSQAHKNLEQTVGRFIIFYNDPKFRKSYGSHFRERISHLSNTISVSYRRQNQWKKSLKYAWYHFRFAEQKKDKAFQLLFRVAFSRVLNKMKRIVKRILTSIIEISYIKRFLLNNLLKSIGRSEKGGMKLFYKFRGELQKQLFSYPSIINNGFLHIQRAIEILKTRPHLDHLIIDVGSAGGETCILFSKAFPGCRIYGFEPILQTFKRLEANTKYFYNIRVYHIALGNLEEEREINITNRITSSSLLVTNENQGFDGADYFKILEKEKISLNKLDNVVLPGEKVALIKIDVQGFELEVLKGALRTLQRTRFVLLEMQNHHIYKGAPLYYELDEFLRHNDFELFEIIPSIREQMQIKEFDALYINKVMKE